MRALFNRDIATGTVALTDNYSTTGPADTWAIKNEPPSQPLQFCYVWAPTSTCNDEQLDAVENGTAVIKDWLVVDRNTTALFPGVVGSTSGGSKSTGSEACAGVAQGAEDGAVREFTCA